MELKEYSSSHVKSDAKRYLRKPSRIHYMELKADLTGATTVKDVLKKSGVESVTWS